jgi:hypothetical protein
MQRFLLLFLLLGGLTAASASPIAGAWRINLERSTELSPWRTYELAIEVNGDDVTIKRKLAGDPSQPDPR